MSTPPQPGPPLGPASSGTQTTTTTSSDPMHVDTTPTPAAAPATTLGALPASATDVRQAEESKHGDGTAAMDVDGPGEAPALNGRRTAFNETDFKVLDLEEKRRAEALDNMEKIEREFSDLKEKFFQERIVTIKEEEEALAKGTHPEFLEKCKKLEAIKNQRLYVAQQWKTYQIQNIIHEFDGEKQALEQEFEEEKRLLRERLAAAIEEKKRKLEEERSNLNLTDVSDTRITRALRRRMPTSANKEQGPYKRKLNPPQISYTLKENEITEDLSVVRRAMGGSGSL